MRLQHVAREARKLERWDDITAMLNQTEFLELLECPRARVFTVNAKEIDSAVIDKKVLHTIKNALKDVPRVLTTVVDSIEIECRDDQITCIKILAKARKEIVINLSWKRILRLNVIDSNTMLYIDTITRIYKKRDITY